MKRILKEKNEKNKIIITNKKRRLIKKLINSKINIMDNILAGIS